MSLQEDLTKAREALYYCRRRGGIAYKQQLAYVRNLERKIAKGGKKE